MMFRRIVTSIVVVELIGCSLARAALYEFTLAGEVTQASWSEVSIGDRFTIKYVADSTDRNPDPRSGGYRATAAVVALPKTTIHSLGPFTGMRVDLNILDGQDLVSYNSEDDSLYTFYVRLRFPGGMLLSDLLPLTLPMENAVSTSFYVWQFGPEVRGTVTSYNAIEVPESASALWMMPLASLTRRRRPPTALR
jgi:hypothetical protein